MDDKRVREPKRHEDTVSAHPEPEVDDQDDQRTPERKPTNSST